ncbi:Essential recombination function protein [uncultured Caudovirales phage]|uniref:Essential recombination function protein n=1 Tax=uncultured Caudovirales phage TaxID=2100421 RepID=A0A6J7WYA5_9CAUD|nr:Essential recombination function protein [uncultured Caudovirales phage]
MNTSESIELIATALAKAQGEVANPVFNKTNPHFKSSYADLSSVLNAVRPILSKNGISIMQLTNLEESGLVLYTRLTHSSGQWVQSVYPVTASGKHQEIAASLTYAKRLSLSAIVGVSGEDDDDGNAANTVPVTAKGSPKPKIEASKLTEEQSMETMDGILVELDECKTKEDLQAWAAKNSPAKQTLWGPHQTETTKAFQAAQERIRTAK